MKEALEKAIQELTEKSRNSDKAGDAMQYAQAALNLSHAWLSVAEKR